MTLLNPMLLKSAKQPGLAAPAGPSSQLEPDDEDGDPEQATKGNALDGLFAPARTQLQKVRARGVPAPSPKGNANGT